MMTTSGFSASTVSASASVLKRNATPRSSQRASRQSMMLIISRRRGLWLVSRIWPPALGAASSTTTVVAALGGDACRLQPGRPGADDDHLALDGGRRDVVRHRQLAAGGRVVDAVGLAAGVDAVQAEVGADAGADRVLLAGHDLAHDVRVGQVGARHADHVELARGDRMARRGHVLDLGGVEGRETGGGADLAGEVQVRVAAHALHRDQVGQAGVGVDMAAHDVEVVDQAAVLEHLRDRRCRPGPRSCPASVSSAE